MEIACINASSSLSSVDCEFFVQACSAQLVECAQAWGVTPYAAALYSTVASLPQDAILVCEIVDDLDDPGVLGYHTWDGRPYIKILAQGDATSVTCSHEFLETLIDPTCDRWVKRPDGSEVAVEICDPVESDVYAQPATVLGETRQVQLSNYIEGSAWFDPVGKGPFDRMGKVAAPFALTAGGYCVVIDKSGNEHDVFARIQHGSRESHAVVGAKLANPGSRLLKRLRKAEYRNTVHSP